MQTKEWVIYEYYNIHNPGKLIDHCLKSLANINIRLQFKKQKVVNIIRMPILHSSKITPHGHFKSDWGFDIVLNETNTPDVDIVSTAHELGHTFEAYCNGICIGKGHENLFLVNPSLVVETSEDFAEAFGQRWLEVGNNRSELSDLLRSVTVSQALIL